MPVRHEIMGAVVTALAVLVLASLLIVTGVASPLQRLAADALVRTAGEFPPPTLIGVPDVAIVRIDPQSLRAFPEWPWPRQLYAAAVDRLTEAGAAAIAFDVDFSTPREAEGDAAFADAIGRSGRVVLAAFRQVQKLPGGAELEIANLPFPALADRAAAIGSVLMPVDSDGVVRRGTRASRIGGTLRAPLAGAALAVASGRDLATNGSERAAAQSFPVDYRRRAPAIPEIPIVDVIEGRFDASLVRGRVVLIGATAAEFQDLWSTPVGPARPGVWIQAVVARNLAAEQVGEPVLRPAPGSAVLAASALCIVALAPFARWPRGRRLAVLALSAGGGSLLVFGLLVKTGLLLDPVVPLFAMGLQYVMSLERVRAGLSRLAAERERSLATLSEVGLAATAPIGADPLSVALALLGDVVDARAVALLRADADGELDCRRIDWLRHPGAEPAGEAELAREVMRADETRVVRLPGRGLAVYVPLRAGEVPVGVLVVERAGSADLEPIELRTIATVGTQIALSAENLRLLDGLRATFDSAVEAIASAVEARDGYTESHCRRLAVFSVLMAERLGIEPDEVEAIRLGALLHDVGKIGIRDEVLLKPGRFDADERKEMQRHADLGHRIVLPIHGLTATTAACVRHHHERWDGLGYPDRLAGEEIPLGARIVALVDVWDALSTARPYKEAYPQEKVIGILQKGRGTNFEPALVDLFLEILEEEGGEMLALTRLGSVAA